MTFNEDTRVKIPAILTLTRLGYQYISLKNRTDIDPKTNIFKDIFFNNISKLRPTNRAIISLFSPARIYDFLHFGICKFQKIKL